VFRLAKKTGAITVIIPFFMWHKKDMIYIYFMSGKKSVIKVGMTYIV